MINIFNKKILEYQDVENAHNTQYFYNPLIQKNDFEKIEKYEKCVQLMLKDYESYSQLDQAVIIFQSMYDAKTKYYGPNGRLLKRYQIQYRLNMEFAKNALYDTQFRKEYGLGLILPEIYLRDIKNKDANCLESSVVLGNMFRSIGIECYFKINYISSHVRLIAKIENKYWNFQFQDTGNVFSEELGFSPDGNSDEKLVLFWNMICGKILGIQKQVEKAILIYDQVEYELRITQERTEDVRYLVSNRITTLIKNQKYKQALKEINESEYKNFIGLKRSIFDQLDNNFWLINWEIDEQFENIDMEKYIPVLQNIIDVCLLEEKYFINGYDIDETTIKRVNQIKENAMSLLKSIQER